MIGDMMFVLGQFAVFDVAAHVHAALQHAGLHVVAHGDEADGTSASVR